MDRRIDAVSRILISERWRRCCPQATAIIKINDTGLVLEPYDPEKHDLDKVLYRKIDDHGRVKFPSDLFKALGFTRDKQYHLYIAPDNTAYIRKMGCYCDVCGEDRPTRTVLGRELCDECFGILKRSK